MFDLVLCQKYYFFACHVYPMISIYSGGWLKLLQLYREADLHEEKDRISRALGAITDESILKKVLQFAVSVSFNHFLINYFLPY